MNAKAAPAFPDRWVRVICHYSADGVWNSRGEACDADDLPISAGLIARLRAWQALYDARTDDESAGAAFDVEPFAAEGLAIARAIKAELPDWTVVYWDEAAWARGERGPRLQYEIA